MRGLVQITCLVSLFVGVLSAAEKGTVESDLISVAEAVRSLLVHQDTKAFAKTLTPSVKDFQDLIQKKKPKQLQDFLQPDQLEGWVAIGVRQLEEGAKRLITGLNHLGIEPNKLSFKVSRAEFRNAGGRFLIFELDQDGFTLPTAGWIVITLEATALEESATRFAGTYEFSLRHGVKYPKGWTASEFWVLGLPDKAADEETRLNLAMVKAIYDQSYIDQRVDPKLQELGERVLQWLRQRDDEGFVNGLMPDREELLDQYRKAIEQSDRKSSGTGFVGKLLTRVERRLGKTVRESGATLNRLGIAGSKFAYRLTGVRTKKMHRPEFVGDSLILALDVVRVDVAIEATAPHLSAPYAMVLELSDMERMSRHWACLGGSRWKELPDNLLTAEQKEKLKLENYVAKHRALPAGIKAPDAILTRIEDGQQFSVSDLRGKTLVLKFWSTWCGPCQEPMAELHKYLGEHPEWKEKVEFITVSIDSKLEVARRHLEKRGWVQANNTWAGPGEWKAPAASAFRVSGIPHTYVIDEKGMIAHSGYFGLGYLMHLLESAKSNSQASQR